MSLPLFVLIEYKIYNIGKFMFCITFCLNFQAIANMFYSKKSKHIIQYQTNLTILSEISISNQCVFNHCMNITILFVSRLFNLKSTYQSTPPQRKIRRRGFPITIIRPYPIWQFLLLPNNLFPIIYHRLTHVKNR